MSDIQKFHPIGLALIMLDVWLSWQALSRGLWILAIIGFVIELVLVTVEYQVVAGGDIRKSKDNEFDENREISKEAKA